ncbi:MAG: hypothetical protein LC624_08505 [Halobacteriales archaeon]|nr:hypothetical protein [Halobacteriales archaeon]
MDRRLLAALLLALLTPALAGCTATPKAAQEQPAAAKPIDQPKLVNATEAANVTSGDGPGEFQKSLDEKFHTHNYWGGALEKVLMDADVDSAPLVPDPTNRNGGFFNFGFRASAGGTSFLLPEGSIVPPETNKLEVTVTWADSPTITGLRLGWNNASSQRVTYAPPMGAGGGTVGIACDLLSNDIPHTSVSKWGFYLQPSSANGPGLFNGTAHVTVKAFRNDTLFVAPPHPDYWGANTTLPILNVTAAASETDVLFIPADFFLDPFGGGENNGGFDFFPLPNGTLIPPHTGVVNVVLTWKNNSTLPNPDDMHPTLGYVQAGSRGFFTPAGERDGDQLTFAIPADARHWDSPYQNRSQWGFVVFLTSQTDGTTGFGFTNVGQFDGFFHLEVVAEREAIGA